MLFEAILLYGVIRIIDYGVYQEKHFIQEFQNKMEIK